MSFCKFDAPYTSFEIKMLNKENKYLKDENIMLNKVVALKTEIIIDRVNENKRLKEENRILHEKIKLNVSS
jgi:hypothetical protein